MSEERLQKILARAGIASRRKAEELIREGRVTVNGQLAGIGDKADLERDSVKLDDRRIQAPAVHRYLLLNKPRGVMSTISDPAGRPTVIDLVPPALRRALAPVGRLDFQTEGLLLLTDDGDLAQHVAHPSFGCWKTYEVKVRGRPADEQIERLRSGIVLEGRRTAPCRIAALPRSSRSSKSSRSSRSGKAAAAARRAGAGASGGRRNPRREPEGDTSSWWSVELGEGRTRQIREMFQRIGHPVQKLRRIAIGPVSDPDIPVGSLRELSEREVAALRRAGPPAPRAAAAGRSEKKTVAKPRAPRPAPAASPRQAPGRAPAPSASPVPRRPAGGRAASASPGPRRPSGGRAASPGPRRAPAGRPASAGPRSPAAGRAASTGPRRPPGGRGAGPSPRRPPAGRRGGAGRPGGGTPPRRGRG
ncbi:MAG TPA: pseudouridine synthase [Thermoanaerobaculia bacterium]|nr:pseudouridine synthase [Thermoanaerobaculia bacterium]